jgi:hypothetical protein
MGVTMGKFHRWTSSPALFLAGFLGAALLAVVVIAGIVGHSEAAGVVPRALNNDAATDTKDDKSPALATDDAGNWVAVWDSDFNSGVDPVSAHSSDNGETWSPVVTLNTLSGPGDVHNNGPQIATDGAGTWIAVWWSNQQTINGGHFDNDIAYAVSTNNGATWSSPQALNSNAATATGDDERPPTAMALSSSPGIRARSPATA